MRLILAVAVMLAIDMMLFFGQTATHAINPAGTQFYNYDGSMISKFDSGNYTLNESITGLPELSGSVSPTTGNIFTDTWTSLKNWFMDATGADYLFGILNAVPNFLKSIGLPTEFAFGLGYFWHALTIFMIIMFFRGVS